MTIKAIRSGIMGNNTYILEKDGECAVIDPARRNKALVEYLESENAPKLKYILLTHGHFDHVWDAGKLREMTGAKIAIHKEDANQLEIELQNAGTPGKADMFVDDGDEIFGLKVMHTPGHSRGSVCFLTEDEMFSGDTVFEGTIGRTDFEGGSPEVMRESLRRISALEKDYVIYPGHGGATTLNREKADNPYFER